MKTGRKPAEALSVIVTMTDSRIPAPNHLTGAERVEWESIVNTLPADYFRPSDAPLLGAFCAANALYKRALAMIKKDGMVLRDGKGRAYAHPAKNLLTSQASAMAQMAAKLRLCPSARSTPTAAASKTGGKTSRSSSKPWDR